MLSPVRLMTVGQAGLLLLFTSATLLSAQEVKYIDLSAIQQRTSLRHPPATASDCPNESCFGVGEIADGIIDRRDPHALGAYLLSVSPIDGVNPFGPFEAEFKILNTGLVTVEVPAWPHLSDLQPADDSAAFAYLRITLAVEGDGRSPIAGTVSLYGSPDREGTILVLKPGEWIRVKANVKPESSPSIPAFTRFRGTLMMQKEIFHPRSGGGSTDIDNLGLNTTPTPWIPVHFRSPHSDDKH